MAINFNRLFATLGKIVGGLNEDNTYRGTTLGARVDTLSAQFNSALQDIPEGLYPARNSARSSHGKWLTYLANLAQDVIVAEVDLDRPIPSPSLASAILELDRQMKDSGESLAESPASVTVTPNLTDGSALLIATIVTPSGVDAQLAVADNYRVTVPRGFLKGDVAFQEILAIEGEREAVPALSWEWPGGSGTSTSLTVRDANTNVGLSGGRLNTLTNWTGQTGGTWSVGTATAELRDGYTADVTKFAPSGAAGYIEQTISVRANTIYGWTVKVYVDGGSQDWDLVISLVDEVGTVVSKTIAASTLSAGWNTVGDFFATPEFMDTPVTFRVGFENIVTSSNLELAHAGIAAATPLYTGGLTMMAWAGTAPLSSRDEWDVEVTIGGTGALHRGVDRLVDVKSVLPQGLPVSGTPTQSDALVS